MTGRWIRSTELNELQDTAVRMGGSDRMLAHPGLAHYLLRVLREKKADALAESEERRRKRESRWAGIAAGALQPLLVDDLGGPIRSKSRG